MRLFTPILPVFLPGGRNPLDTDMSIYIDVSQLANLSVFNLYCGGSNCAESVVF